MFYGLKRISNSPEKKANLDLAQHLKDNPESQLSIISTGGTYFTIQSVSVPRWGGNNSIAHHRDNYKYIKLLNIKSPSQNGGLWGGCNRMLHTPPKRRQISQKMPVATLLTQLETPLREKFRTIYQNRKRLISITSAHDLSKYLFLRKNRFMFHWIKKKLYCTPFQGSESTVEEEEERV